MGYTISIKELLTRPIIRNEHVEEWLNKMTDEEILQWDKESREICLEEGTPNKFPDINAAHLAKYIDRTIMYTILNTDKMCGLTPENKVNYVLPVTKRFLDKLPKDQDII